MLATNQYIHVKWCSRLPWILWVNIPLCVIAPRFIFIFICVSYLCMPTYVTLCYLWLTALSSSFTSMSEFLFCFVALVRINVAGSGCEMVTLIYFIDWLSVLICGISIFFIYACISFIYVVLLPVPNHLHDVLHMLTLSIWKKKIALSSTKKNKKKLHVGQFKYLIVKPLSSDWWRADIIVHPYGCRSILLIVNRQTESMNTCSSYLSWCLGEHWLHNDRHSQTWCWSVGLKLNHQNH